MIFDIGDDIILVAGVARPDATLAGDEDREGERAGMPKRTREELLEAFRRNKRNRRVEEWLELLQVWGFEVRVASKEGYLVRRGDRTYTLPNPHGGDPALKLPYAVALLRLIDDVKADVELEGEHDD